jgi:hypothetical protein
VLRRGDGAGDVLLERAGPDRDQLGTCLAELVLGVVQALDWTVLVGAVGAHRGEEHHERHAASLDPGGERVGALPLRAVNGASRIVRRDQGEEAVRPLHGRRHELGVVERADRDLSPARRPVGPFLRVAHDDRDRVASLEQIARDDRTNVTCHSRDHELRHGLLLLARTLRSQDAAHDARFQRDR